MTYFSTQVATMSLMVMTKSLVLVIASTSREPCIMARHKNWIASRLAALPLPNSPVLWHGWDTT